MVEPVDRVDYPTGSKRPPEFSLQPHDDRASVALHDRAFAVAREMGYRTRPPTAPGRRDRKPFMPHQELLSFLARGGVMAGRVHAFDWAATPLGEPSDWCPELLVAARFVLESKFPSALVWGREMTTIHNDGFLPILGEKPDALGRSFRRIWAEAWDAIGPIAERALAGNATFIEDFPLVIDRHGYAEQAYFTFSYTPVRLTDGTVAGFIDTVMETTGVVQARERNRLLNSELGHRLKNQMSLVQAIAIQSLKRIPDRAPVEAFKERIVSLGRANDILLQSSWEGAAISDVVAAVLEMHDGESNFDCSGAPMQLGPRAVLSLSMLLHELATNAAKHGALSVPGGRVELRWSIEGDDLLLRWREHGGPPAHEPSRTGFGSRIINLGLMGTRATAKHYRHTGFEAEFRASLVRLRET